MDKVVCSIEDCGLEVCMTVKSTINGEMINACPIHGYLIFFHKQIRDSAELVKIVDEAAFYQMLSALKADGVEFDGDKLLQFIKEYTQETGQEARCMTCGEVGEYNSDSRKCQKCGGAVVLVDSEEPTCKG